MMKPSVLNFGLIADIISFRSAIKSDPSSVEEMVITVSALELLLFVDPIGGHLDLRNYGNFSLPECPAIFISAIKSKKYIGVSIDTRNERTNE